MRYAICVKRMVPAALCFEMNVALYPFFYGNDVFTAYSFRGIDDDIVCSEYTNGHGPVYFFPGFHDSSA